MAVGYDAKPGYLLRVTGIEKVTVFFAKISIGYSYGKSTVFQGTGVGISWIFYPGMESVGYGFRIIRNKKANR